MEKYYIEKQNDDFYGEIFILMRESEPNLFEQNPNGIIGKYQSMDEAKRIKKIMEESK